MGTFADIVQLISAIAGIGSLIGVIVLWRKARWEIKHEEASTAEAFEGIAERTLRKLSEQIERNQKLEADVLSLRKEVHELRVQVEEYEKGINLLVNQLELNSFSPVWRPKKLGV